MRGIVGERRHAGADRRDVLVRELRAEKGGCKFRRGQVAELRDAVDRGPAVLRLALRRENHVPGEDLETLGVLRRVGVRLALLRERVQEGLERGAVLLDLVRGQRFAGRVTIRLSTDVPLDLVRAEGRERVADGESRGVHGGRARREEREDEKVDA